MKVKAQVFTKKGFYGEEFTMNVGMVSDVSSALIRCLDEMEDEIEGEKLMDWTKITVEIIRS